MDRLDSSNHPISVVLDGTNYVLWAQAMSGFLKGKKLWRIITGDVCKPIPATTESAATTDSVAKYADRLEDWDSKNYQIITWLRNTSITSISLQFGRFQLDSASSPAKAIWDFLQERYQTTGLAHQYQLLSQLHRMRQDTTQTINDFLSQMYYVWDQLALSEPPWDCTKDAALFTTYRDQQRLVQFLMALTPRFEPVRASLLHRTPLPTLEQAISELLSEETRFGTLHPHPVDSVLATPQIRNSPSPSSPQKTPICNYCQNRSLPSTHLLVNCPVRLCRFCNKTGPGHLQHDCFRNPARASRNGPSPGHFSRNNSHRSGPPSKPMPAPRTAATASEDLPASVRIDPSTPVFSHTDVDAMFHNWQNFGTPPSPALSVTAGNTSWYFDSACCNHMTFDPTIFTPLSSTSPVLSIHTADGSLLSVSHVGSISTSHLSLSHVYLMPALTLNLISISQLCEHGLTITFSPSGCLVQDPRTGQTLGIGRKHGRLYELIHLHVPDSSQITAPTTATTAPPLSPFQLWHCRLGHLSVSRLKSLISRGHLGPVSSDALDCVSCQLAKQPALSFNKSDSVSLAPFDLIHSDIWGPSPTPTMGGARYFVVFVDDFSRFTWLFLMKNRSELKQLYYNFSAMVKTQFSKTIKLFRSDNAMEYKDFDFLSFLQSHGTQPHRSCPGTSQQNGRAERKHRHILDTTRALLLSSSCPEHFWGEAALTAAYTINCIPTPVIQNHTPYERLHGTHPPYTNLRVFGSACFVLLQPHERTKLEPRSCLCCFLGYGIEHKGYRCSSLPTTSYLSTCGLLGTQNVFLSLSLPFVRSLTLSFFY
ncbi:unnamed protein product [Camellia sinensis]